VFILEVRSYFHYAFIIRHYSILNSTTACINPHHFTIVLFFIFTILNQIPYAQFTSYEKSQPSKGLLATMYNSRESGYLPTPFSNGGYFCVSNSSAYGIPGKLTTRTETNNRTYAICMSFLCRTSPPVNEEYQIKYASNVSHTIKQHSFLLVSQV
jgi:hypothetical protein